MKTFHTQVSHNYIKLLLGEPDTDKYGNYKDVSVWKEGSVEIQTVPWRDTSRVGASKFYQQLLIRVRSSRMTVYSVGSSILGNQCKKAYNPHNYPFMIESDDVFTCVFLEETWRSNEK